MDRELRPAPCNSDFLAALDSPLAVPELARFNVEFNNQPHILSGQALSDFHAQLPALWRHAESCTADLELQPAMISILPTLPQPDLGTRHMSDMNRYPALNSRLTMAQRGLAHLGLEDAGRWLDVIAQRTASRQHGAAWQRRYLRDHGHDLQQLKATYLTHQNSDLPVHA
ncbi:MAG: hypothetical protein P8011_03895 [Acidihalobacter sp.]|uniref:hypothetical protein n=1 Tax=Acidihalobacter sp. TaxID=1872108 RepID=UPI00307CEAD1